MASENENEKRETVADIVAMVRRAAQYYDGEAEKSEGLLRETFKLSADNYREIANLVEAAWKRESRAIATEHAVLPAVCITKPSSNAAAMREAAVTVYNVLEKIRTFSLHIGDIGHKREFTHLVCLAKNRLDAALAEPARNCDLPLVVDGPADNNADKAWLVFKHHNPDAYFDVSGLLRCIDWLFAPAAERKGEGDGR